MQAGGASKEVSGEALEWRGEGDEWDFGMEVDSPWREQPAGAAGWPGAPSPLGGTGMLGATPQPAVAWGEWVAISWLMVPTLGHQQGHRRSRCPRRGCRDAPESGRTLPGLSAARRLCLSPRITAEQ